MTPSALFSPIFSRAGEKIGPPEADTSHRHPPGYRDRVQHFLFVSPKRKRWQKKKAPGGISNFPPDPLKATRKTTSVFLDLSYTAYRPGGTIDVRCTRKPNGTARRPSPTRKLGFLRRIPNNSVGDGLCAVPLYAPRRIRTNQQVSSAAVLQSN